MNLLHILLHIDQYLNLWTNELGPKIYYILFLIVFCETGLVITPFLPGDSMLFALGAMAAVEGSPLNIFYLSLVLIFAAFCGDNVNYRIGKTIGPKIFSLEHSKILNKKHLIKTQKFYEKYGSRAVIIARFIPIVRTFVPFVAGIGKMPYKKFISYSFVGSLLWTQIFLFAGNYFGGLEVVRHNFQLVILAIIFISILPGFIAWFRAKTQIA